MGGVGPDRFSDQMKIQNPLINNPGQVVALDIDMAGAMWIASFNKKTDVNCTRRTDPPKSASRLCEHAILHCVPARF